MKKKFFKELENFLCKKLSLSSQKHLGSGKKPTGMPEPGSRGQKDTGSATLIYFI
jgi:hypothetical protein